MRKMKRFALVVMAFILLMTTISCGKNTENARRRDSGAPGTPTMTAAATPTATEAPTATPSPTEVPPTPTPTGFQAPEEGCAIAFPERERYRYTMDLTLDADAKTVSGHVVFDFYNDSEDPWDRLCLRDYSSVFIDGRVAGYPGTVNAHAALTEIGGIVDSRDNAALTFTRDTDVSVVWIALAKPLSPGEKMTLTYDFKAQIPTLADRYGYHDGIFNVTNFYPVLAEYVNGAWSHEKFIAVGECFFSEVADFDVRITAPEGFIIASSGTEKAKETKDGKVVYTLKAPCIRSFAFCASDRFAVKDATYDGVHVNVLYNGANPPSWDIDTAVEKALESARDSLAAYGKAFGRYPYEELDIIFAPIDAGGMEYPNLVIITSGLCAPIERGMPDNPSYSYAEMQICIAHEIGHQWFMGIVGSNSGPGWSPGWTSPWHPTASMYTRIISAWTAPCRLTFGRRRNSPQRRCSIPGKRTDIFRLHGHITTSPVIINMWHASTRPGAGRFPLWRRRSAVKNGTVFCVHMCSETHSEMLPRRIFWMFLRRLSTWTIPR